MERAKICILVKAYPQPSQKYQETVCCAGITQSGKLIRLYPIPYRALHPNQKFNRFDWIECDIFKNAEDFRPESYKVSPESIAVIHKASDQAPAYRAKLWAGLVSESLERLKLENSDKKLQTSLGIIKPDTASLLFSAKKLSESKKEEKQLANSTYDQCMLFEDQNVEPLPSPEYTFRYRFESGGKQSDMMIHDWEVQAAFYNFKRRYGTSALERLVDVYQRSIPTQNLHFIMGTQKAHPHIFMIIGLLRTSEDIDQISRQSSLF